LSQSIDIDGLWFAVCSKLQSDLGAAVAGSWISPLHVEKIESGTIYLAAESTFLRDWVQNNYAEKILYCCKRENSSIKSVEIVLSENLNSESDINKKIAQNPLHEQKSENKTNISIPLDPKLTFENFVVGKPNEFAHAAALRIAESDKVAFNPLFLYGSVGLGKTHLMNAIAWGIKSRNPERTIAYLSAEKFMYQFVKAVRFKDTISFKKQFRSVDVLMIDDIQFICGKDSTQEEFFHTFNTLVDNKRQVIVSADKSPSDLDGMEERLKSRLGWGLVADIHPTTYELRLGILQAKASLSSVHIPDKVLEFVAHKVTSNIRELEGALNRITANAMFVGREVTVDSAKEVLSDLLRTSDRKVTIDEIQKKVATHYAVKFSDMSSARRVRQVAMPRHVAMYLAKKLTTLSLPEIGRNFGGRDHTTVLHAVKKIEEAMNTEASLAEDVRLLIRVLEKPT
jgi:chromosomal replication initiator protein